MKTVFNVSRIISIFRPGHTRHEKKELIGREISLDEM
jgi:hypothetical protein